MPAHLIPVHLLNSRANPSLLFSSPLSTTPHPFLNSLSPASSAHCFSHHSPPPPPPPSFFSMFHSGYKAASLSLCAFVCPATRGAVRRSSGRRWRSAPRREAKLRCGHIGRRHQSPKRMGRICNLPFHVIPPSLFDSIPPHPHPMNDEVYLTLAERVSGRQSILGR